MDQKQKKCCSECKKELTEKDSSENHEYEVCLKCEDLLPNESGYCSLSCKLGNGCDGSC